MITNEFLGCDACPLQLLQEVDSAETLREISDT